MLPSNINTLLKFQPPTRQLLQQQDIHTSAKKYYDFFSFTDNAISFLKQYLNENFNFLNYFDQSSVLLIQTCHNFHSAWPKLHQDPSPLISVLILQLQNTLSLASSLSPMEFKVEDEIREAFSKKINSIKDIQQTIDKKFQTLWKQCHNQTSTYYQKLEEYKDQTEKVRQKYDKHEKEIRDFKGYNVTLKKQLEERLNDKVSGLSKAKEAFEQVFEDSKESYTAVSNFFEANRELVEEFLKLFLKTSIEMTTFLTEKMLQNLVSLKQTTTEILQTVKKINPKGSWETEDNFLKEFSLCPRESVGQIKEINRLNHHRQEFVNAVGFVYQEILHLCEESIEKYTYFEDIDTFNDFFSQYDPKIAENLLPFAQLLKELRSGFVNIIQAEKASSDEVIQKLASVRSRAYSALLNTLPKLKTQNYEQDNQIFLDSNPQDERSNQAIRKTVTEFLLVEENLGKEFVKYLERLYTVMNQDIWTKMIQGCQKRLTMMRDKVQDDKLTSEVRDIQDKLVKALGYTEAIETLETRKSFIRHSNRELSGSFIEENMTVPDEQADNAINRYNQGAFKFIKEKQAESLAEYVKRKNDERLKEINPNPYAVEFEKEKTSLATEESEAVLDSFACSFVEKMSLHGRIYITSAKIVFKSYFNGRTLFGTTVMFIPLKDIVQVIKKKNMLGIQNMIEITTRKGLLLFSSFVFRDKAYELIHKILTTMQPGFARGSKPQTAMELEEEEVYEEEEVHVEEGMVQKEDAAARKLKKQRKMEMEYQKRNKAILKEMPPLSKYENQGFKFNYPVDFNTFFRVFMCKTPISFRGKDFSSCWEILETVQGTYDLTVDEWSREVPKDVKNWKELINFKSSLERNCVGRKKLDVPVPFAPKNFQFNQQSKLFFVNEKEIVLILEVDTPDKLPLSDTFKFRTCYVLKDETGPDGKPNVSMSFNYYADWYKSTILKGVIIKAAIAEIKNTGVILDKAMTEVLNSGVFERKRKEIEQEEKQVEESDDEEENEENIEVVNGEENGDVEIIEELELNGAVGVEYVKVENVIMKKEDALSQVSEFKISRNVLFIYFSVSLVLLATFSGLILS